MSTLPYRWFPAGILGLVAVAVAASGCGGNRKVTIKGTVSYKGQPLSGGMLQFVGPKGGAPSAAPIQKDGTFIITDVVPGEVKVGVLEAPQGSRGPQAKPVELPDKYRDPEKSEVKYTITPETTELRIDLK